MSHRDDILDVLSGRRSTGSVPIWELSFHGWDAISGQHLILGRDFENLSQAQQERALHTNAEIILESKGGRHEPAIVGA